jgi:hypothetical protein
MGSLVGAILATSSMLAITTNTGIPLGISLGISAVTSLYNAQLLLLQPGRLVEKLDTLIKTADILPPPLMVTIH